MAVLDLIIKIGLDKQALKKANAKIGSFLKTGLKAGALGAAGALATVGVAATAAAAETIAFADEANAAMEDFRRTTGISEEGLEAFAQAGKNLFALGVGEGIGDIAEAMAEVNNVMQTGAEATENITRKALVMRDAFGKDVGGSVDAVKVLMDEFGLSADESFNLLAAGIQGGLDRSGDFLDTIREYGNLFAEGGASAAEFFSFIETGSQGGVLGTDKAADAFKEFQIRILEGGKDVQDAFDLMGIDYLDFASKVGDGTISTIDAFNEISKQLRLNVQNPIEQNTIGVALFGTQFEDMGKQAIFAIDPLVTSMQDLGGAMDRVEEKNVNIAQSMENLRRQMVVALEPAAQELMPLLAEGVSKVAEFLTAARPIFTGFAQDLSGTLGPAMQIIGDSLARIATVLGITTEGASGMDAAMAILKGTLDLVVTAIEAVAIGAKLLADAFEFVEGLVKDVKELNQAAGAAVGGDEDQGLFGRQGKLNFLGLQKGGEFTVGGSGGPDSQFVGFRASPGERVTVTPAGQAGAGGMSIVINNNAPILGVDELEARFESWGQQIVNTVAEAMR